MRFLILLFTLVPIIAFSSETEKVNVSVGVDAMANAEEDCKNDPYCIQAIQDVEAAGGEYIADDGDGK